MIEPRFNFADAEFGREFIPKFGAAAQAVADSPLPLPLQGLVKIRANQINGCGVCTDMHTRDALAAGETQERLNLIVVWRHTVVFTEAERAVLAFTEQAVRLAGSTGVDDQTWDAARTHLDDEEMTALVALIAIINSFNLFNVIARRPAGEYRPGEHS